MRISLFILFALVVVASSKGLTLKKFQQTLLKVYDSPFVSLMLIYDSSTEAGPQFELVAEQIGKSKKGYFEIHLVDCNTDDQDFIKHFAYCEPERRKNLPALSYLEPGLNQENPETGEKYEPNSVPYAGKLDQKSLYDFAIPLMKAYSVNLKKMSEYAQFKSKYPQTPKLLYFTDKQKLSPFYKLLTAHFRKTIAFAHVFKNSSLCEEFGVTEFPTLLLNGKEHIQMNPNLLQQVQILQKYKGPSTNIYIEQFQVSKREVTKENIEAEVYKKQNHILIHVPDEDGKAHPQWKKCQDNFKKMFQYYETEDLATELGVKYKPALVYFPKSLAKKHIKKTIFYAQSTFRQIYDEIASLIEDFTVPLINDREMQAMTSLALEQGRFVAVLFHKDQISLSYRVLSNDDQFKESLTFFRMKDPQEDVLEKFKIKKLPSLLVMTIDKEAKEKPDKKKEELRQGQKALNLQIAQYNGKFNYDDLSKYFSMFVEKKPKAEEPITYENNQIHDIKSKKRFENYCVWESCLLLLVDGNTQKKESNQVYIETLRKGSTKTNDNIGVVDGVCHPQILQKLEILPDELPTLVYFNAKLSKFTRLIGRVEDLSLSAFISKIKIGRGPWKVYDKIAFEDKDCAAEHQKIKKLQTGYTMSEEQIKILEEIRKEEQIKKGQSETKESSKKRSKGKKRRPKQQDSEL